MCMSIIVYNCDAVHEPDIFQVCIYVTCWMFIPYFNYTLLGNTIGQDRRQRVEGEDLQYDGKVSKHLLLFFLQKSDCLI